MTLSDALHRRRRDVRPRPLFAAAVDPAEHVDRGSPAFGAERRAGGYGQERNRGGAVGRELARFLRQPADLITEDCIQP